MMLAVVVGLMVVPGGAVSQDGPPIPREKTGAGLLSMCEKYEYRERADGSAVINEDDVACHYYVTGFLDVFALYQGMLESWTEFGKKHAGFMSGARF